MDDKGDIGALPVDVGESDGSGLPFTHAKMLDVILWHLDRYDRLRSSTSTRASVLLSANGILVAGSVVFSNSAWLANSDSLWLKRTAILISIFVIVGSAISIHLCINAIATWRTARALHRGEIPSRFMFNWGDTLKSVDGYSGFRVEAVDQGLDRMVQSGLPELWTAILQHKRRHKYLRYGVHSFRLAAMAFLILMVVVSLLKF